ncbi:MAG: hypothetical protein PHE26_09620 [Syntrophomonadaceae bacterium]|nr:hypothetical protein [Syntrophomonadaceae bacterium]
MDNKMMLQSCISHCNNSKSDIENLSSSVQSSKSRDELNRATQAINDCISHCQSALKSL